MSDYYIVRGARIYCECGSHLRKLDMPAAHGSYIRKQPMMHEKDCQLDENIPSFGICYSESNENPKIEIKAADPEDLMPAAIAGDGTWVPPDLPLEGRLCKPELGPKWLEAYEDTLVDGKKALTLASHIACACGGTIYFLDNGQGVG